MILLAACDLAAAVWKKRYWVAKGRFIFKYASYTSSSPKGTPIPIDSVLVDPDDENETAMRVSTLRKDLYVVLESKAERDAWIR